MHYEFTPRGVCSRRIEFDLDGEIVQNVRFQGGCDGNLKAVSKLVEGKPAREIEKILRGNTCGFKQTSCADQFAIALRRALDGQNE